MTIHEAIPKIMAEIGHIGKDRKNEAQKYQFRGIDDLYNACQSALIKHGVFCVPTVLESHREERKSNSGTNLLYTILTVKYTFYAQDGSSIEAITVAEGMDTGDKSAYKAMSGAQKYALLQVFAIPTEEAKDAENDSHQVESKPTLGKAELIEKMATAKNAFELKARWTKYADDYKALSPEDQVDVRSAKDKRKVEMEGKNG